jgi:hypothetical protein
MTRESMIEDVYQRVRRLVDGKKHAFLDIENIWVNFYGPESSDHHYISIGFLPHNHDQTNIIVSFKDGHENCSEKTNDWAVKHVVLPVLRRYMVLDDLARV